MTFSWRAAAEANVQLCAPGLLLPPVLLSRAPGAAGPTGGRALQTEKAGVLERGQTCSSFLQTSQRPQAKMGEWYLAEE